MEIEPGTELAQGGGFSPPGGPVGPPPGGPGGFSPIPPPLGGPPGGQKPITGGPRTMAMHVASLDPNTGLPVGEKPPASAAAVVSLVAGILLCVPAITGLVAIGAGVMALLAARRAPTLVGGRGLAYAGIGLGLLNLVISAVGLVLLIMGALS